MTACAEPLILVLAEDDEDDRQLYVEAMDESALKRNATFVGDGLELLELLRGEGRYARQPGIHPDLILLDLNMPRMDGREALRHLKADPLLRRIPVLVLTTSSSHTDLCTSYDLGAASYIQKPDTFSGLVRLMMQLQHYWQGCVRLPGNHPRPA